MAVGCLIKGAYAMLPTLRLFLEEDNQNDDDSSSKLKGLLDGVELLDYSGDRDDLDSTLVTLADMAVGCLIKGAYTMLPTLRLFLEEDNQNDDDSSSKLQGLLDGVELLDYSGDRDDLDSTLVTLADMAVGCLIKGAYDMVNTLRLFLKEDNRKSSSKLHGLLDGVELLDYSGDRDDLDSTLVTLADMAVGCLIKGAYDMLNTLRLFLKEDNRNDDDSSSKLQGLLDGVELLEDSGDRDDLDSTLVTLAGMAVGCLIKGAYTMLPTLHLFLEEDNRNDDDSLSKLQGLLDGVELLDYSGDRDDLDSTLVTLADMAVGCLIKGAYDMLNTLRLFLEEDNRNDDDSSSKLKGLLDGVKLLDYSGDRDDLDSTLVTLADMAVGCLIKGAYAMLPTLCLFLEEDNRNDDDSSSKLQGLLDGVELLEDSGDRDDLDSTLVTLADMTVGCLIKGAYAMLPTLCLFLEEDNRNDDDSSSKLQGLLDGVELLEDSGDRDDLDSTLVTLADMAVGCLIKGAYAMLPTLCLFLEEDNHYNATRASLMLAATRACVLSIDSEAVLATMGEGYNINVKSSPSGEDLVWLVRCLLWVGVARDSLKDTLILLNAIVPDALRN